MNSAPSILAVQPGGIFQKKVQIDGKGLFTSVAKTLVNLLTARPVEAISELPEIAASLGLSDTEEDRTWLLVFRGLERALCEVLKEYFRTDSDPSEKIKSLDWAAAEEPSLIFNVGPEFFTHPADSVIARNLASHACSWMSKSGIPQVDAVNLSLRVPGYFPLGLHNEWRSDPAFYAQITARLDSPFLPALNRELEWSRYNSILKAAIDDPVFEESFSLRQIYVPARAFYYVLPKRPDGTDRQFEGEASDRSIRRQQKVFLA